MHDQTTPLFSQSGEMLSFSRGGGTSSNTTNKYIYTRAYEKTTKRALFLSLVLSLFLLLLLLRARVFPLNKYVVTLGKDENSFLLLSNARSRDENTPKRAKDTNPRILRHSHEREIRHTREISFSRRMFYVFLKKSDQRTQKWINSRQTLRDDAFDAHFFFFLGLLSSCERENVRTFLILSRCAQVSRYLTRSRSRKRRFRFRRIRSREEESEDALRQQQQQRDSTNNTTTNGVTNRRLCRRRRGD